MPKITNFLSFSEKRYDDLSNQSVFVLNATDPIDTEFQFQFRYIQDKSKKINFEKLKEYLRNNTKILSTGKRILYYPGYKPGQMDKIARTQELFKLFPDVQLAEFIYNKFIFRKGEKEIKDPKFINFFKIFSFQENTKNSLLGYEIPETNAQDIIPNYCIYSMDRKLLANKTYLFPYCSKSLEKLANEQAMKKFPMNAQELKILHFDDDNHPNRNIYLVLLQNICEILEHLKKPKFFGETATDKIAIFLELADMISQKKPLINIKEFLNSFDKVEILSKHRDPWGIFAFFKGETHSISIWNTLRKMLTNNVQSTRPSFSHQSS